MPHIGAQYNMDRLVSANMRHCVQEGLTVLLPILSMGHHKKAGEVGG